MPETSINETLNPAVESNDVTVVIYSPEEVSASPQEQELQNEPPSASVPTTAAGEKEDITASTPSQEECRICLMSDEVGQLIKPCNCIGSVQFAHLKCLKLWVHERADLHCEICKSMYKESLLPELQADLQIGLEERNRRNERRRLRHHHLHDGEESMPGIDRITAAQIRRQEEQQYNTRRFWIRALCISIPLTILIVMLLFLGMNASDNAWAAILLRILAFALPTFIVVRVVFTCWDVARVRRGDDDEGLRRGVGV